MRDSEKLASMSEDQFRKECMKFSASRGGRPGARARDGAALFAERGAFVGGGSVCAGQRGVAVGEGAVCAADSGGGRGNAAGSAGRPAAAW
jgi:hypothetical protein